MRKKKLILVRGVPGQGKSTYARKLRDLAGGDTLIFESDNYLFEDDEYKWHPNKMAWAHKMCQAEAERALYFGFDAIVANTHTTVRELQPYFDAAKRQGADLEIYQMTTQFQNVHAVPEDQVQKMRDRFASEAEIRVAFPNSEFKYFYVGVEDARK